MLYNLNPFGLISNRGVVPDARKVTGTLVPGASTMGPTRPVPYYHPGAAPSSAADTTKKPATDTTKKSSTEPKTPERTP